MKIIREGQPWFAWSPFVLLMAVTAGCGPSVTTHAVRGKIDSEPGAPSISGHVIEAALASDPNVRATAEIQPDGSFKLESLIGGRVLDGALEGKYNARVVLVDDDPAQRKQIASLLSKRYLQFEQSGWSFNVPAQGDVSLRLSKK